MKLPKGVTTLKDYIARRDARRNARAEKGAVLWKKKPGFAKPATFVPWKYWRDVCDDLVKTLARRRDGKNGGLCRICGRRAVQAGYHIIPCGKYAVRWDPENVVGSCHPCNRGEQLNRLTYVDKHMAIFGPLYDRLLEKSRKGQSKFSVPELQALATKLRAEIQQV